MGTEEHLLQIQQSTMGELGTHRIGVVAIAPMDSGEGLRALLSIVPSGVAQAQRNDYETRAWIRGGDLLPVGTSFYRVVEVTPPKRKLLALRPGSSQEAVSIDREAVQLADLRLADAAMILLQGGTGELHGREFAVETIGRRAADAGAELYARLAIWSNDLDKDRAEKAQKVTRLDVQVGSLVTLGAAQHRVLGITEANAAQRLPGLVQLAAHAEP